MNLQQKLTDLQDELTALLEEAREEGRTESATISVEGEDKSWDEGYAACEEEVASVLKVVGDDYPVIEEVRLAVEQRDEFRKDVERLDWAVKHGYTLVSMGAYQAEPVVDVRQQIDQMRNFNLEEDG